MFGYYPNRERKDFLSNPSVRPLPVVKPKVVDGRVTNEIVKVPQPIGGLLAGHSYDEETMSLRAKLNLGVQLDFVPNANLDNDPLVSLRKIERLSNSITNMHAQLLAEESAVETPKQE